MCNKRIFFFCCNVFIFPRKYVNPEIYILKTREIPAFGVISLAIRGSGAFGATFGASNAHLGKKKKIGAPCVSHIWGAGGAPEKASASAAFGG